MNLIDIEFELIIKINEVSYPYFQFNFSDNKKNFFII